MILQQVLYRGTEVAGGWGESHDLHEEGTFVLNIIL